MKKTITKKYFTLLEVMVTIALLSICFSIVGIKIHEALYSHKYKNNIKTIESYFIFCRKMALSNQADIYLNFKQENEKIYCEMGTDEKVGFFKNTKKTKDIFDNMHFLFNDKKAETLEIVFSSSGEIFPKGVFKFCDKKQKFEQIKII